MNTTYINLLFRITKVLFGTYIIVDCYVDTPSMFVTTMSILLLIITALHELHIRYSESDK